MSTDSVIEEKIMLNLLDLHKRAKATYNNDQKMVERDIEALERSLISSPNKNSKMMVSKTPHIDMVPQSTRVP
jgi:hypothetical protein